MKLGWSMLVVTFDTILPAAVDTLMEGSIGPSDGAASVFTNTFTGLFMDSDNYYVCVGSGFINAAANTDRPIFGTIVSWMGLYNQYLNAASRSALYSYGCSAAYCGVCRTAFSVCEA